MRYHKLGTRKRRKSCFKPGHEYIAQKNETPNDNRNESLSADDNSTGNGVYLRLPDDDYRAIVEEDDGVLVIRNERGEEQPARILRPRPQHSDHSSAKDDDVLDKVLVNSGYRLYHRDLTAVLFNEAFKGHSKDHPRCNGDLYWSDSREEKFGLCWTEALVCKK